MWRAMARARQPRRAGDAAALVGRAAAVPSTANARVSAAADPLGPSAAASDGTIRSPTHRPGRGGTGPAPGRRRRVAVTVAVTVAVATIVRTIRILFRIVSS